MADLINPRIPYRVQRNAAERPVRKAKGHAGGGSVFEWVQHISDAALNLDFMVIFPLGIAAAAINWLGQKTNSRAAQGLAKTLEKPVAVWNTPFAQAGEKLGLGVVGSAAQATANVVGSGVGGVMNATGFSGIMTKSHLKSAGKHLAKAQQIATGVNLQGIAAEFASPLHRLGEAVQVGHLENAKTAITEWNKIAAESKVAVPKDMKKFLKAANKAIDHQQSAMAWSNPSKSIANMPSRMASAPIGGTVVNTALLAGSALATFGTAKGFSDNLESLRQMYADVTGQRPSQVSTATLLTGKVPAVISEARNHLVQEYGTRGLIQAAGLVIGVRSVIKTGTLDFIRGLILPQVASMGVDAFMGTSVLPVYKNISDAHARGERIAPDVYREFLMAASPDLKTHRQGTQFAVELAERYSGMNLSPADLLKRIESKVMLKDIEAITKEADAATHAAQPAQPEPQTSMVQKLQEGNTRSATTRPDKPVLGKHTDQIVSHDNPGAVLSV